MKDVRNLVSMYIMFTVLDFLLKSSIHIPFCYFLIYTLLTLMTFQVSIDLFTFNILIFSTLFIRCFNLNTLALFSTFLHN